MEGCPVLVSRLCHDIAIMLVDNLFCNTQPDPCTGIMVFAMQPLEEVKDFFAVLQLESDAVVTKTDVGELPAGSGQVCDRYPVFCNDIRRHADLRGIGGKLQRIAE